ncbi:electron transporter RnfC [Methyloprofundus sedimenti]|uniref:Ion-translocating oxidoreductase complex subunit C n=2 Tax=Methyloprofundus sedimenti TaxID=1420851 RepID=A0A1V8M1Z2_9GAMM|nr:electron transport complex subunit RsxC [Methyloprofundus sedimenti]OQK15516.1 electron transporter RnfC [Methyloprofundus sedimenti]
MISLMDKLRIRGGVHAAECKSSTSEVSIATDFPLAKKLYIPLQQHVGKAAEPVVKVGDKVLKGQLLAHSQGMISAPVHAPSSGLIADINFYPGSHPSALPIRMIVLATDGLDAWGERQCVSDPFALDPEEISLRVGAAGIVGMGGATFPAAVKLNLGRQSNIHTLLINGGECEPYLTCDDRLMQERADDIIDGIRIMLHGMNARHAKIGIEDNKPEAIKIMRKACEPYDHIYVITVPTRYPMGWDRQMIRYVTGKEVPAGSRATDVGVVMHNVATAYAIHKAIRKGEPLVSRIVTVSGGATMAPKNIEVPIGTLISELFAVCQVDAAQTARIVMGGPMMGDALPHSDLPIVKASSGVLALNADEIKSGTEQPCIRCASCIQACPAGLLPVDMVNRIRSNQLDAAVSIGLKDCISCGSCSYVCPSNIPLVHYFKYATGELVARQQAQHKTEQTNKLMDDRNARMERIEREQAEEAAQRQAEKEARKRAKAEKAAREAAEV